MKIDEARPEKEEERGERGISVNFPKRRSLKGGLEEEGGGISVVSSCGLLAMLAEAVQRARFPSFFLSLRPSSVRERKIEGEGEG